MIKLNGNIVEQKKFPDGTLLMKLDAVLHCDYGENEILWNYESDSELFSLICLVEKIRETNKADIILKLPYIPHARFDRVENRDDVFTLKTFAKIINSLNFSSVEVLDAHSNVSLALIDNVDEHDVQPYLDFALDDFEENGDDVVICFPDAGAQKRYKKYIKNGHYEFWSFKNIKNVSLPFVVGNKVRDWDTGKILEYQLQGDTDLKGKHVLIVDDICSYGGTFVACAKALIEKGVASVSLYVSHCENNVLRGELLKIDKFKTLITTDSLVHSDEFLNHDKVQIIDFK